MAQQGVFRRNICVIFAVALVMLMADLLVSVHVLALTDYISGEGNLEYTIVAIRYLVATLMISAIGFLAGLLLCISQRVAWYGAAVCVVGMFVFQANIYFTDYSVYGFLDALLFIMPRLMIVHLILLAVAPIGAAVGAQLGIRLHEHIGEHTKCPVRLD